MTTNELYREIKDAACTAYCQSCVYRLNPVMLTGYSITQCRCDGCGKTADLALVKVRT